MHVDDVEWETCVASHALSLSDKWHSLSLSLKASGEQIDDRVVEVRWDPVGEHWRMMRFRDDKPNGNHRSIVEDIVQTIADGVEKDTVSALLASP